MTVVVGTLGDGGKTIAALEGEHGFAAGSLDFAFVDHAKEEYLPDLERILERGWLHPGSVVVADNVKVPGAPEYREYMREHEGRDWRTTEHETHVEYQTLIKDLVLESEYVGDEVPGRVRARVRARRPAGRGRARRCPGSRRRRDQVASLPDLPVPTPQYAGYASTSATDCADVLCTGQSGLFYWLATRGPGYTTQPTILWSNGGPGSSSMYGFFSENGPYTIIPDGQLRPYPDSWTNAANYLVFDHPLGIGLSFPVNGMYAENLGQGITQLRTALGARDRAPRDAGEPALPGRRVLRRHLHAGAGQADARGERARRRVQPGGVVIVAGWVDPLVQVGTIARYALTHGLIDADQKAKLDEIYERCQEAMDRPPPSTRKATEICESIQPKIAKMSGRYLANIARPATSTTSRSSTTSIAPTCAPRSTPGPRASSSSAPTRSTRITRSAKWTRSEASSPTCSTQASR